MRIELCALHVDDQEKVLRFYTDGLGFRKARDIPAGAFRWISVVSPQGHGDVELVLEPNVNPATRAYQEALLAQGIPATAFATDDIAAEVDRLKAKGVAFTMEPTPMGPVVVAVFADTCGNLIQLYQKT
ncbi:MAG: VOC family protein [bacterium]|nr:VOC family protein [bacterium]